MIRIITIVALTILLINTTSCKKRKDKVLISVDSMAISYYGGFTDTPEYGHFMIANGTVKEDTGASFSARAPFDYTRNLGQDAYNQVAHLLNEVPKGMKDRDNYIFSDNVVDGGATRAIFYIDGNTYTWDCGGTKYEYVYGNAANQEETPDYIIEFIKKLQSASYFLHTR